MNTALFLKKFKHLLLIGGKKREEVIAEIYTHLNELKEKTDTEKSFGDPRRLAIKLNRIHIGFFSSYFRLFGFPVFLAILIVLISYINNTIQPPSQSVELVVNQMTIHTSAIPFSVISFIVWISRDIFLQILPIILAALIGRKLFETRHSRLIFILLSTETIILSAIVVGFTDITNIKYLGFILFCLGMGVLSTLFLAGVATFSFMLSYPIMPSSKKWLYRRAWFDILLFCFAGFVSYLAALFIADSITYPHFTIPVAIQGSAIASITPLIHRGEVFLPLSVIAFLFYQLQKRLRRYRSAIREEEIKDFNLS